MDGVARGIGDTSVVTTNNQSHLASPTQPTQRILPAFSSPSMATKTDPPAAATAAISVTSSPGVKTNSNSVSSITGTTTATSNAVGQSSPASVSLRQSQTTNDSSKILDKRRLQELVKEVDPLEQLDEDVEEMLMQIADDFIDNVVSASCQLAKHRKANTVEVKDVQLHLERNWNMWIPGFGSEELKPYKKSAMTEAHKQRLALIKKTLKKY